MSITARPRPERRFRAPGRPRIPLVTLLLALLFFWPSPSPARKGDPPPRFPIDAISIEDARWISGEILLSVSLLEERGAYTEAELRDAVYRIVRLPFILDADYALEEGDRGVAAHRLTIRVIEGRRWFFGVEADATRWAEPVSLSGLDTYDYSVSAELVAGRRIPVGSTGLFTVGLGGEAASFALGYTHYALLGGDKVLELSYALSPCDVDRDDPRGVPDDSCGTEIFDLGLDPVFSS